MAKRSNRPDSRAVYVISVAAELAGVHPQTLRIYERKGLLSPARTPGNTRRYSDADIARLRMIQRLTQELGVSLAGVAMILEMEDEVERLRRRSESLAQELERARDRMREELERRRRERSGVEIVPVSTIPSLVTVQREPTRNDPRTTTNEMERQQNPWI